MQPKTREVHVVSGAATVQNCEDISKPLKMLGTHPLGRTPIVQGFEPTMLERPDHAVDLGDLGCRLSLVN